MTPQDYLSAVIFPLSSQPGLDLRGQMLVDAVNLDQLERLERAAAPAPLPRPQRRRLDELRRKASARAGILGGNRQAPPENRPENRSEGRQDGGGEGGGPFDVAVPEAAAAPAGQAPPAAVTTSWQAAGASHEGYTGELRDSIGRTYHFVNGRRVKSSHLKEHERRGRLGHQLQYHRPLADEEASPGFARKLLHHFWHAREVLDHHGLRPEDLVADPKKMHAVEAELMNGEDRAGLFRNIVKAMVRHKERHQERVFDQEENDRLIREGMPPPVYGKDEAGPLVSGRAVSDVRLGRGANLARLLTFEDGGKAVFKADLDDDHTLRPDVPGGYWKREVAASEAARLFGVGHLVPATAGRVQDGRVGSAQRYVDAAGTAVEVMGVPDAPDAWDGPADLALAASFDLFLGNTDRHLNNWMVTREGKLVLIDNGLAFPTRYRPGQFPMASCSQLLNRAAQEDLPLPPGVADWDDRADAFVGIMKHVGLGDAETDHARRRLAELAHCARQGMTVRQAVRHFIDLFDNGYTREESAAMHQEQTSPG